MEDEMTAELLQIVESTTLDPSHIAERTARIHAAVLGRSNYIDAPDFTCIHPDDLEILFAEYDRAWFDGRIREALGKAPLHFGLSKRMTTSGGATVRHRNSNGRVCYDIKVSTTILFGCFHADDHRPLKASGIVCRDRLDALQRVMEHELAHLVEMLLWDKSSCAQPRFHSITLRFFGHTEHKHQLITPRETACVRFGIVPGMTVRFRYDGVEHQGIVNRINKRATVLVENGRGERYSNGKHYARFYVPVPLLEPFDDGPPPCPSGEYRTA
jgi:hypothetical protein